MTKDAAREFFIETAEDVLKKYNVSTVDPKKAEIERKYDECVKQLEQDGIKQERIEAERQRRIQARADQQMKEQEA